MNSFISLFKDEQSAGMVVILATIAAFLAFFLYFLWSLRMARKPLSEEQLAFCLKNKGRVCPCCGEDEADELVWDDLEEVDDEDVFMRVTTCNTCNQKWSEFFALTKVDNYEE